ncbi:MAG: hypothetical protein AAGJ85_00760 [Pseudomonadota bacterium]
MQQTPAFPGLSEMSRNPQVQREPAIEGSETVDSLASRMGLTLPQMAQALRDNVMGDDDDTTLNRGEMVAAALNKAGESMTLGLVGDEAAGAVDEALGRRENGVEFYREQERQLEEQAPKTALASELAGAVAAPGLGAANYAARGATRAAQLGRAALTGAVAGGTYAAAEAEGGAAQRAIEGAVGAVTGGVLGAGVPAVASAMGRGISKLWQRAEARPSVGLLREVKNRAYRAVEDANEVFDGDEMTALSARVRQMMADDVSYSPGDDTAVDAALKSFVRREGEDTTLSQLDTIRQRLWKRVTSNPDQVQIYDLIGAIDETIDGRAATSELMGAAREANRQFSQTKLLDSAFQRARDQAESTGSGGNVANLYRQAVTRIINNPKQSKFFSQEQIDLMREFITDSGMQRLQRRIGKLSPSGNGLMLALHTVGGVASGGATLPFMAAGEIAKRSADGSVLRGAERILDSAAGFTPEQALIGRGPLLAGQLGATTSDNSGRSIRRIQRQQQ